MAAGTQVVSNDAELKVEIDEKCVGDLDMNGLSNVGGNSHGDGKDESDDSSYVFVSGGDPGDTGGGVKDVDVTAISDSADEVDRLKKEELVLGSSGVGDDTLVLETNAAGSDSLTASDAVVKAVSDDVDIEHGSAVDHSAKMETSLIDQDVNGEVVKNNDELADAKEIADVESKPHDVSAVTLEVESAVNTTESSQVTDFEPESISYPSQESKSQVTITQSLPAVDAVNTSLSIPNQVQNAGCEVIVNDEPESIKTVVNGSEFQATVDGSGKPSEDLEGQVVADDSESSESLIMEREVHVAVDESGKLSESLERQNAADGSESSGGAIEEQKGQVTVDGSESIGSLVENQEHLVLVDDSERTGDHTKEVDSSTIVMESDLKSGAPQELLIMTLEVNVEEEPNRVCDGIKSEHISESVSPSYPSENKKAGVSNIGSGIVSELYPDTGLVSSEDTDALVDGQVEKFDGILEMVGTHHSGIEAYESEPLLLNADVKKTEEKLEKQVEGSSERFVKTAESEELMADSEAVTEQVKIEYDIQESRTAVIDNVQDDLNLETVTNIEPIIHENTVSHCEASDCIESKNVETLDPVKSECKTDELLVEQENDSLSNPDDSIVVEQKAERVAHHVTDDRAAEGINFETRIENENVDVSDDEEKETAHKESSDEFIPDLATENRSAECIDSQTGIENYDVPDDEEKETETKDVHVRDHKTSSYPDTITNPASMIEFGSFGRQETIPTTANDDKVSDVINVNVKPAGGVDVDNHEQNVDGSHTDKNSDKRSSVEDSVSDAVDVQDEKANLGYNFLIKIPRFEDESFREDIRSAQSQVANKTSLRDAIRVQVLEKRDKLRVLHEAFNAALSDENKARRLVKSKRQEIDSVLAVINRLKNAMTVEDIDKKILGMEHMIQHETIQLKDEKQFIREIKRLKTLRDHLASNMGTSEEIRLAIDQKDQNEELLKSLRKELDALKDKVSKAEEAVKAVRKIYEEEHDREREMQIQFRAADGVRQQAYAHLNSLKKLSYDKNQRFRQFKEDQVTARHYLKCGDNDSFHRLCAFQVETFMGQWINDDEFRKEYASRWTTNANRKQRAPDGGSLVHDDVSPPLPSKVNQKADTSLVSIPIEVKSVSEFSSVEQEKVVSVTEDKHAVDNSKSFIENISETKNQTLKSKDAVKPTLKSETETVTELPLVTEAIHNRKEEENALTKEEIELTRKAEEIKKEETEAKLKEQRRLEEKAKAIEALERKKRNAEKAQIRAELRARKEAEQKEKEREKRLRKKEKKKAGGDGSVNGDDAASSESSTEATVKELESVTKKKTYKPPPPRFFSKQLKPKPVPPPLLYKNRKAWQQNVKLCLAAALLLVFIVFLVANTDYYVHLKFPRRVAF